ncbi:atypical/HisK protein kinase [Lyophyllum atratum]|nr:atypical/HisK protein kinase [Lyophyllum atratum]
MVQGVVEYSEVNRNFIRKGYSPLLDCIDTHIQSLLHVASLTCLVHSRRPTTESTQPRRNSLMESPRDSSSTLTPSSSAPALLDLQKLSPHPSSSPRGADLSGPLRRFPLRSSARPSTAPEKEEVLMLPSLPPGQIKLPDKSQPRLIGEGLGKQPESFYHMHTVREDDADTQSVLSLGILPSPFNGDAHDVVSSSQTDTTSSTKSNYAEYDWATFINAYANGRWDPHRTPNPPRSYVPLSTGFSLSSEITSSAPSRVIDSFDSDTPQGPYHPSSNLETHSEPQIIHTQPLTHNNSVGIPAAAQSLTSTLSISPTSSLTRFRPGAPTNLPLPAHRMWGSLSNSSGPLRSPGETANLPSTNAHSKSEVQTTVATLRWAAARVDISPLALPSPEHELTDPMRGVTATVPGSHPPGYDLGLDHPLTPGGTRKTRLASFWRGTTDVEKDGSPGSFTDSPTNQPPDNVRQQSGPVSIVEPFSRSLEKSIPPASAPQADAYHSNDLLAVDYFGSVDQPLADPPSNIRSFPDDNELQPTGELASVQVVTHPTSPELGTMSVPALPRRLCLTRQTSSPLPVSTPHEPRLLGGRGTSETITSIKAGRAAKEEQMFAELGYLAPPNPPDELERRRALYKFNIWNTGPDLNFDRIAHLAKLVFSTKGVLISLIDGKEQWHKSEWGLKTVSTVRTHTLCAHAILQQGDEPMVILDTHLDWRFAKNPLVTGAPHMRFYAGAPLRTTDGFNIGTLAIMCDNPREDFSPRQKHTLKEFAAIAMREMELWRDKIQLRIRDRIQNSMEQFSRECLEIDTEVHAPLAGDRLDLIVGSSMDKVYDRAAKLVKRTLDVEGVIVMDVSHCEVLESMSAEGTVSVIMHYGDPQFQATNRQLTSEEYQKLNAFFAKHPDGKISEGIVPPSFRPFLPTHIQYALTVPIFNIDKRPFALLCAYNGTDQTKRYLEGHELSYLRAIGVIILSAVLKRRMILADKAKSLFISNISHELRTPLHGILAAAELLSDSQMNHSQLSFLQTVQACGNSLVETVNHVLDFTKLSGNSKAGGVENVIVPSKVDLMQLVEEAVDGCWIGHRARAAITGDSGIGSVYSPPTEEHGSPMATRRVSVETVVDIGYRREGWTLRCEKGGIRRVLMNVFGNSLKFTGDGFVHVVLRQLPPAAEDPPNKVKIELAVVDTGKGISQNFLKNQLFHPFSQENPLQTGTGLGLAIVNSIVTSESVGGKVEVWSEEGAGTEIKVTFSAEKIEEEVPSPEMEPFKLANLNRLPTVSLIGFDAPRQGAELLRRVLENYFKTWWGLEIHTEAGFGDIVVLNEDPTLVQAATDRRDTSRPFIIFSAARGNSMIMAVADEHERIGGFCRILFKPGGPSRLWVIVKLCLHALKIGSSSRGVSPDGHHINGDYTPTPPPFHDKERSISASSIPRRKSEEGRNSTWSRSYPSRPPMSLRASTTHPITTTWRSLAPTVERVETPDSDTIVPTIAVGTGGSLLKSSVSAFDSSERRFRVLVVEDNNILRNLLIRWLSQKGYDFRDAVDGRDGVTIYESEGPFDVVLLDLSMPVLDGVAATAEIRLIESKRAAASDLTSNAPVHPSRILALTGMSSLEDKRRAFEAGVDGYLVKPVAFKTLEEMFHRLGLT